MATGVSGYLPSYKHNNAYVDPDNCMYIKPHYVEEYYPDGNYSIIKIDYIAYTASNYSQSVNWSISGKIDINGQVYSYNGTVTTSDYKDILWPCSIVSAPIYHDKANGKKTITITLEEVYTSGAMDWGTSTGTLSTANVVLTDIPIKHAISINAGVGSAITVQRISSNVLSAGELVDGSYIYEGDILQVSYAADTGYNLESLRVNGSAFTSGNRYTVPESLSNYTLTVVSNTTVKSFVLSINKCEGSAIVITRTSSPKQGADLVELLDGATIYYSDELHVAVSADDGYNIVSKTIDGADIADDAVDVVVTNNVSVISAAELKSYILTLQADDGSEIIVNRTSSRKSDATIGVLEDGATIYHFDAVTITFNVNPEHEILMQTVDGRHFVSGDSAVIYDNMKVVTVTGWLGIIYVNNGEEFDRYCVFVYGDSGWEQYIPYVYNGSSWDQCS